MTESQATIKTTHFNRAFEEESSAYKIRFGHDDDFYGECRYRPDESSKYSHAGSPLNGAWRDRDASGLDKDYVNIDRVKRVRIFLRHQISSFGKVRMLPDGFVHMTTMFAQNHMYDRDSNRNLSRKFRMSYMNTRLDESRIRFTIIYLPERKRWGLVHGTFEPKVPPVLYRRDRSGKEIKWD